MSRLDDILKDVPWISVDEIKDDFFRGFVEFNISRKAFNLPYKEGIGDDYPAIEPKQSEKVKRIKFAVVQFRDYPSGTKGATLAGEYEKYDGKSVSFTARSDNSIERSMKANPAKHS